MRPDVKVLTVPIWLISLIGKVSFNAELQFIAELMSFFDKVGEGGNPAEANKLLGTPMTTLEQWCEKQRNVA